MRSVIRVREEGTSQSLHFPLETLPPPSALSKPRVPQHRLRQEEQGLGESSEGSGNLSPLSPPSPDQLRGWQSAAALAAVRGALTCSACCGPDANPPCAGERGAGTQTGVTTAPKAASLCSSRSREHFTSPPSSPPTPAASAAGAPHFRLVHKHGQPPVCALGHSAHLLVNQSSRSSPI